eukprot:12419229-Alexandrium_andersonii.AAC.1
MFGWVGPTGPTASGCGCVSRGSIRHARAARSRPPRCLIRIGTPCATQGLSPVSYTHLTLPTICSV